MIRLVDKVGVSLSIPPHVLQHIKLFDLHDACSEEGEKSYPMQVCSSFHLRDLFYLLELDREDDRVMQVQQLLNRGFDYFGTCLTAAEFLQCDTLVKLFKKVLSERVNAICDYQHESITRKFFEDKAAQLRALFCADPCGVEPSEKLLNQMIVESRLVFGQKFPFRFLFEEFYTSQDNRPYLKMELDDRADAAEADH